MTSAPMTRTTSASFNLAESPRTNGNPLPLASSAIVKALWNGLVSFQRLRIYSFNFGGPENLANPFQSPHVVISGRIVNLVGP